MARHASADPPGLPAVVTAAQAQAAGISHDMVAARVSAGRWVRLHRGVFLRLEATLTAPRDAEQRDLMHVYSALGAAAARPGSVVSHSSAALALRLPLVSGTPAVPHLTAPPTAPSGPRAGVIAHRRGIRAGDASVVDVHDIWRDPARGEPLRSGQAPAPALGLVTSPSRTVLDVARTASLADALSVGDRAIRSGLVTPGQLADDLIVLDDRPGTRRAALALAHLDGGRESSLESFSFAYFLECDLPLPEVQVVIELATGQIARVDFLWREFGVIGEADGAMKYRGQHDLLMQGQRETLLRDLGYVIVRWTWADIASGRLFHRLLSVLGMARAA